LTFCARAVAWKGRKKIQDGVKNHTEKKKKKKREKKKSKDTASS